MEYVMSPSQEQLTSTGISSWQIDPNHSSGRVLDQAHDDYRGEGAVRQGVVALDYR